MEFPDNSESHGHIVFSFVEKVVHAAASIDPEPEAEIAREEPDEEPAAAKSKLFKSYRKRKRSGHKSLSADAEIRRHLMILDDPNESANDSENPLKFWVNHSTELPKLACLARQLLVVPATSAPIERVFSHGGIIIRPTVLNSRIRCYQHSYC